MSKRFYDCTLKGIKVSLTPSKINEEVIVLMTPFGINKLR